MEAISMLDQNYDVIWENVQHLSIKLQNENGLEKAVELIEHNIRFDKIKGQTDHHSWYINQ